MTARYVPNDRWARRAKDESFRARSVYKLEELDRRFRLFQKGMRVLDLGAAPGSWLQYVAERIGPQGKAIGCDLQFVEPVGENVRTFVCDLLDDAQVETMLRDAGIATFDVVLSDMAPATSGIKDVDQWRSIELCTRVLSLAEMHLKKGGSCVMKVLRGGDFDPFLAQVKRQFRIVKIAHVRATREGSREVFVVGMKKE